MKKFLLLFPFIVLSFKLNAQDFVASGQVLDSKTGEELAFANVFTQKSNEGVTTDVDGKFTLKYSSKNDTLVISYLSYKTKKIALKSFKNNSIIRLEEEQIELEEIVVSDDENPAHRIIRNAIKNRKKNKPESLDYFSYDSYNKMNIFPAFESEELQMMDSVFSTMDLMIWESITHRKFRKPNKSKETVLASRISGLKSLALPLLPTDFQDFSFYKDWVNIVGMNMMSPLHRNAIQNYDFYLEDYKSDGKDTVFTISFKPNTKKLDGFIGFINIHSKQWAILNVKAKMRPAEVPAMLRSLRIQQQYESIGDSIWFPAQYNTDITWNMDVQMNDSSFSTSSTSTDSSKVFMKAKARSYLKNITINEKVKISALDNVIVEVDKDAANKNEDFWNEYRQDSLTKKEQNTYQTIDSLSEEIKLDRKIFQIQELMQGRIAWKFLSFEMDKFLNYNRVENFRLGLGLLTNSRFSKRIQFGGSFGYGFGDKKLKYSGKFLFTPFRKYDLKISGEYENDLLETGYQRFGKLLNTQLYQEINFLNIRSYFVSKLDYTEKISGKLFFRTLPAFTHQLIYSQSKLTPAAYSYELDGKTEFDFTEVSFETRIAFGEKFLLYGFNRISIGTKLPILKIQYTKEIGDWQYEKIDISLGHKLKLHRWGTFNWNVRAGSYTGKIPYMKQYIFEGAFADKNWVFDRYALNNMGFNEFAANQYVVVQAFHNFKQIFGKGKRLSPKLLIFGNYAYGTLDAKVAFPDGIQAIAPNKHYFETGIGLSNILPRKKSTVTNADGDELTNFRNVWQNYGVMFSRKVGAYSVPDEFKNWVARLYFSLVF